MRTSEHSIRKILAGENAGAAARVLVSFLAPFSFLYGCGAAARRGLYERDILPRKALPRPVVSIGNLTAGGTGKTPFAALVARFYLERGLKVVLLSRGYGRKGGGPAIVSDGTRLFLTPEEGGDEPVLLAKAVPGLAVVVGSDRHRAGMLAMERLSPDIFILDDGFQHVRLKRDLDILLLDERRPYGNGFVLPAGLLREPRSAMSRAGLLVLTRCSEGGSALAPSVPVLRTRHLLSEAVCTQSGEKVLLGALAGRGIAFAGIADPEAFFTDLRRHGVHVADGVAMPDHAAYGEAEVRRLQEIFRERRADFFITTEKDGIKLSGFERRMHPLYVAPLVMIPEERGILEKALGSLLPPSAG